MNPLSSVIKSIIVLTLCMGQNQCIAQYHDFPVEDGIWVNRERTYVLGQNNLPIFSPSWIDNYCANGYDTTINSTSYEKIDFCTPVSTNYHGAWRYDSGQVFFIPKDSLAEFLLYDFTLNSGDTVSSIVQGGSGASFVYYGMHEAVVDNVDTINVYGTPRRRLSIGAYEWVEGVGCTSGLFMETWENVSNYERTLVCMSTNGAVHFGAGGPGSCDPALSTITLQNTVKIELFPNPTEGEFQIDLGNNYENIEIEIVNLVGQKILNQSFENVHFVQLNIEQNSGVYLVNVSSDGVRLGIISVVKN